MQHLLRSRSAIVVTIVNVIEPGRVETHRSVIPEPPSRSEKKWRLLPSEDRAAPFVCAEIKGVQDSDHLLLALQSWPNRNE